MSYVNPAAFGIGQYQFRPIQPAVRAQDRKVERATQEAFSWDCCTTGKKICYAVGITAAALLMIFLLTSNPVGWIASALHVATAIVVGLIILASLVATWINYKIIGKIENCCSSVELVESKAPSPVSVPSHSPRSPSPHFSDDADDDRPSPLAFNRPRSPSPPPVMLPDRRVEKRKWEIPDMRDELSDADWEKLFATVPFPK
jgi:hypothetical protein